MKKIDKLILQSFIGPFCITLLVVVFILFNVKMLMHFDDILGKGLDVSVLLKFFFYFAAITIPTAFPLAILLASLITFGNLGEHFELTAIKALGISLPRVLFPIFILVCLITIGAFHANNYLVPRASLEAYSLMFDMKQAKPALELKEGSFYRGLDDMSIKVDRKFADDERALKGVTVYDHRKNDGNTLVTIADSGRMYSALGGRFLRFELFRGYRYDEQAHAEVMAGNPLSRDHLSRGRFDVYRVHFNLQSFGMPESSKEMFESHRYMRTMAELDIDIARLDQKVKRERVLLSGLSSQRDASEGGMQGRGRGDIDLRIADHTALLSAAEHDLRSYEFQWYKIPAQSMACLAMFLVGAPLGSIIRKGGLGIPFLVSIVFYIIFHILAGQGEKLTGQGVLAPAIGAGLPVIILLLIGLYCAWQARNDARVFDMDWYLNLVERFRKRLFRPEFNQ